MKKEFIICAAIWVNDQKKHGGQPDNIESGFVIAGRRHSDCYQTIKSVSGTSINESPAVKLINSMSDEDHRKHQGFITSTNRYVGREEAWEIAMENNQIQFGLLASDADIKGLDLPLVQKQILISENLY